MAKNKNSTAISRGFWKIRHIKLMFKDFWGWWLLGGHTQQELEEAFDQALEHGFIEEVHKAVHERMAGLFGCSADDLRKQDDS